MQFPDLLRHLLHVTLGKVKIYEIADEKINRCPLLLLDRRPLRRVDIVSCVLNQHTLLLTEMLGTLLPLQRFEERLHPRRCLRIP